MAVRSGLSASFKPAARQPAGAARSRGRPASVPSLAAFTTRFTRHSTRSLFRRRGFPTCVSTVQSIAGLRLFGGSARPRGRNPPAARGGGGNPAVALSKATLPWLPFRFPGKLEAFKSDILNGFPYFYLTRRPAPPRAEILSKGFAMRILGLDDKLSLPRGRGQLILSLPFSAGGHPFSPCTKGL